MNHKKSRLTDLFRKMDKDNNGLIPRDIFIDGIINTSELRRSAIEIWLILSKFSHQNSTHPEWRWEPWPTFSTVTAKDSSTGKNSSLHCAQIGRNASPPPTRIRSTTKSSGWWCCARVDRSSGSSKSEKGNTEWVDTSWRLENTKFNYFCFFQPVRRQPKAPLGTHPQKHSHGASWRWLGSTWRVPREERSMPRWVSCSKKNVLDFSNEISIKKCQEKFSLTLFYHPPGKWIKTRRKMVI